MLWLQEKYCNSSKWGVGEEPCCKNAFERIPVRSPPSKIIICRIKFLVAFDWLCAICSFCMVLCGRFSSVSPFSSAVSGVLRLLNFCLERNLSLEGVNEEADMNINLSFQTRKLVKVEREAYNGPVIEIPFAEPIPVVSPSQRKQKQQEQKKSGAARDLHKSGFELSGEWKRRALGAQACGLMLVVSKCLLTGTCWWNEGRCPVKPLDLSSQKLLAFNIVSL